MLVEIRDYGQGQQVTFKPGADDTWGDFLDHLRPVLYEAGIDNPLSYIRSLNAQTTDKWHVTFEFPKQIFTITVKNIMD